MITSSVSGRPFRNTLSSSCSLEEQVRISMAGQVQGALQVLEKCPLVSKSEGSKEAELHQLFMNQLACLLETKQMCSKGDADCELSGGKKVFLIKYGLNRSRAIELDSV